MKTNTIKVDGMSCEHCVRAIQNAVGELEGVESVAVSLSDKAVTVIFDTTMVSIEQIKEVIEDQGYDVLA